MSPETFQERFSAYFAKPVAEQAAHTLTVSAAMEFHIAEPGAEPSETFTFTRRGGKNVVLAGPASDPQLEFTMTPAAAEEILADSAADIGTIGVNIAKLVVSHDPQKKVSIRFRGSVLSFFTTGYLGILAAGGTAFASFLASRGLTGISGIKEALKKIKG